MRRLKSSPGPTESRPKDYSRSGQKNDRDEARPDLLQKIEDLQREVSHLRDQRQDALKEIKHLENQLLIAKEQSKKSLDDYADSVAQSFNTEDYPLRKKRDFDYGRQHLSGLNSRPPSDHSHANPVNDELLTGIRSSLNPELASILTSPYLAAEPLRTYAAPLEDRPSTATKSDPHSSFNLPYPVQSNYSYLPPERPQTQAYPAYLSTASPQPAIDRLPPSAQPFDHNPSRESRLRKRLSDTASKASYDQQYLSKLSGIHDKGLQPADTGALRRIAVAQNRSSAETGYNPASFLSDYSRRVMGDEGYSSKRW